MQPTLWESILPSVVLGMPAELERVDRLLDDPRFFEPYRGFFHETVGAAVDPDRDVSAVDVLEVPLQARVRAVVSGGGGLDHAGSGSVGSRSVGAAPHPTTLMKITTRCGETAVERAERGVVGKAVEAQGAQDEPGAGGHHGGRSERGVSGRFVVAGQGRGRLVKLARSGTGAGSGDADTRCGTGPVRCIAGLGMW